MKDFNKIINIASGKNKASLVLKNAQILNVFDNTIETNDVAISDDLIVGVGTYEGINEIDCTGLYVVPGFIDSHVHIESSMVTPQIFSNIVITKGVTTVIADPHEIGNVLGMDGLKFMLNNSKKAMSDIFYMLPSCVPCTDFEDNGATLESEDLESLINEENVLGLGEVMDVPSVINQKTSMIKKLQLFHDKNIDGHCPDICKNHLNAYIAAGIKTDHESITAEEALQKVKRGMYVMLREGSAAKNLLTLLPGVNENNYKRFLFCTDDRHIDDLIEIGSIDNAVRIAIQAGLKPSLAYTISSLNAAECYGLKDRGAIAPGYKADLLILKDLNSVNIKNVLKNGNLINIDVIEPLKDVYKKIYKSSINLNFITKKCLKVKNQGDYVNVIQVTPNSLYTKNVVRKVLSTEEFIKNIEGEDILKIAVFERYKNTKKLSLGYLEGLGLKNCTIAQTIAHDSHNLIVVGDNDKDIEIAVNSIINIGGGIVIVSEGKILDYLTLPIAGLMTDENPYKVNDIMKNLQNIARKHGVKKDFDPFLTLAFMSLPVIPEIKITPSGLFRYKEFNFIDLFLNILTCFY